MFRGNNPRGRGGSFSVVVVILALMITAVWMVSIIVACGEPREPSSEAVGNSSMRVESHTSLGDNGRLGNVIVFFDEDNSTRCWAWYAGYAGGMSCIEQGLR